LIRRERLPQQLAPALGEAASTPYHRRTTAMTKLALFRGGGHKERTAAFPNRKKQAGGHWSW
jgi:hypothetical protein